MLGVERFPRNSERGQKAEDEMAREEAQSEKETSTERTGPVCPIAKRKVRLMRSIKLCQQQGLLHKETMERLTYSNLRPLA